MEKEEWNADFKKHSLVHQTSATTTTIVSGLGY